ncbi:MAG: alpha/beta fold hydrolase [Aureispira sp.]
MATLQELLPLYTDQDSRFLVIDDVLMHYKDVGQGPVLVLIHGAFSSLHTYDAWAERLEKQYRVIRLDLMGFGLTGPNKSNNYSIKNHIRVLKTLLTRLGVESCSLVGSSFGGWVAWEFAYVYPELVQKIVLIDSAGFLEEEALPLPFRLAQSRLAPRMIKYIVRRSVLEIFVKQVFFDAQKVTDAVVTRYFDLFSRDGNGEALIHLVGTSFKDHSHFLKKIHQPTLILWGAEDAWVPVEHAYQFRDLMPNSKLIVYPKVGHIPMEEIPQKSLMDLTDFLEKSVEQV